MTKPKKPKFSKPELLLRLVDLPEAELLKRDLEREFFASSKGSASAAKKQSAPIVRNVEVLDRSLIQSYATAPVFTKQLLSKRIVRIRRLGRYLFLLLEAKDTPDAVLILNFSSGGLLRMAKRTEAVDTDTALIIGLTGSRQLRFLETKEGAQVYVLPRAEVTPSLPLLANLGFDPLDPNQTKTWQEFHSLCKKAGTKGLKSLLCDESYIVGVGDLYSDEVLFHAELNYSRLARSLTPTEVRRLCQALTGTLYDALKHRGASLFKRPFMDLYGEPGSYGQHLEVFMRKGELSSRGGRVVSSRFSNRHTFYCDKTQILRDV